MAAYDLDALLAQFPALAEGAAHFDGPGGSQVPEAVADAVAGVLRSAVANRGTRTPAERRADAIVVAARRAAADTVGAPAGGVVFGRSMTALTFDLARTLSATWRPGDEVVVTDLDHDANIRPWVAAADRAGATVRVASFDPVTGELPAEAVTGLIGERTRVVAITAASNLIGTVPDVAAVAAAAADAGALCVVDAVHAAAHRPVDLAALGADVVVWSPYKLFGPHCGVLAADPALLERLHPDKLAPSSDAVPERFELGTLPYELLAGVTAAVDVVAGLAPGGGDRRSRVSAAMAAIDEHETAMLARLEAGLGGLRGVRTLGRAAVRTPTVLFEVDGVASAEVADALAAAGVNAPAGSFYALLASRRLGLGDTGAVRAGISPYTSPGDVDRLLDALAGVCARAAA
ncbi:MAG TPA: cysteine desulfurase-like protein [Acidimicrobiales bacterium]|nr:cysteine desulfurase-like protein [Acidimicrobiales bacterium]